MCFDELTAAVKVTYQLQALRLRRADDTVVHETNTLGYKATALTVICDQRLIGKVPSWPMSYVFFTLFNV